MNGAIAAFLRKSRHPGRLPLSFMSDTFQDSLDREEDLLVGSFFLAVIDEDDAVPGRFQKGFAGPVGLPYASFQEVAPDGPLEKLLGY